MDRREIVKYAIDLTQKLSPEKRHEIIAPYEYDIGAFGLAIFAAASGDDGDARAVRIFIETLFALAFEAGKRSKTPPKLDKLIDEL